MSLSRTAPGFLARILLTASAGLLAAVGGSHGSQDMAEEPTISTLMGR